MDLIEVENRYSIKVALKNAERLVSWGVDLAIEFQTYERIGTKVAQYFEAAKIPLIAVEIPHPNAVFLGVDNQRAAGAMAGRALLKAAQANWDRNSDEAAFSRFFRCDCAIAKERWRPVAIRLLSPRFKQVLSVEAFDERLNLRTAKTGLIEHVDLATQL